MHADISLGDEKMVSAPLALIPTRSFAPETGEVLWAGARGKQGARRAFQSSEGDGQGARGAFQSIRGDTGTRVSILRTKAESTEISRAEYA